MDTVGVYVHIPFCRARCSYCDFNTYVGLEDLFEPYVCALEHEIRNERGQAHTLFFGGGTPSLLSPQQLGRLITACRDTFKLPDEAEITVECNPGTVDVDYLRALRAEGVNRLSFGAQSADPAELRLLGREHDWRTVVAAVNAARRAGFDNINLDLIFALPNQTLGSWQRTLSAALALEPDHVSLYALIIEVGTPMHDWTRRGEVPLPDPDLAAEMYDYAESVLGAAGFVHYEISNWHRAGRACQHNLVYWRNQPFFGFGAGAHGATGGQRYWRVKRPAEYIARVERGESTIKGCEQIDARTSRSETMMLGLRLLDEGVSRARFAARYGAPMEAFFARELAEGAQKGLLELKPDCVRLTRAGRFVSNQAMQLFV
ncbi:MAG: radical SAM family heme chaperone HemW [Anaerolineae bacterium]|nr:radical SAM family heme chaperone HemW [Thermoflexales bacterium]MDW8395524.1 radical SAM family heme chaperone HemW [Anaerolineae bacterium]